MAPRAKRLTLLLVPVLAAAALLLWWLTPGAEKVRIVIPEGSTASHTAQILKSEGVIRSVTIFKLAAKLTGADRELKPGEYELPKPLSAPQAVRMMRQGSRDFVKVIIPEGFMAKQIADRLESHEITDSEGFMAYVRSKELEGFLFPTTYFFSRGLPPEKVAGAMLSEFRRRVDPVYKASGDERFTLKQVVTLASIVQREAAVIDEMPMIAAVYQNRLAKRMRLEADPTVQYLLGKDTGKWKKGIRYKHLDIRSRYNTYRHFGLPPGPICSPGLAAVEAVLHPADTEALYFVADNKGRHVFSLTYAEHVKAAKKAKQERLRNRWKRRR